MPGTSDPRISSSVEGAEAANRTSRKSRAIHSMRGFFFELATGGGEAEVIDIDEARGRRPEVVAGGTASLETSPAHTDAEGQVVDMEGYRRLQDARAMRDEAYETMPKPDTSRLDDLFRQAG